MLHCKQLLLLKSANGGKLIKPQPSPAWLPPSRWTLEISDHVALQEFLWQSCIMFDYSVFWLFRIIIGDPSEGNTEWYFTTYIVWALQGWLPFCTGIVNEYIAHIVRLYQLLHFFWTYPVDINTAHILTSFLFPPFCMECYCHNFEATLVFHLKLIYTPPGGWQTETCVPGKHWTHMCTRCTCPVCYFLPERNGEKADRAPQSFCRGCNPSDSQAVG